MEDKKFVVNLSATTRREMIASTAIAVGSLAAGTAAFATDPSQSETKAHSKMTVTLRTPNPAANFVFDLHKIKMTSDQRSIVAKLFSKNPTPLISEDDHVSHDDGPASKYLSRAEFTSIRELGVRLGTSGVVAMTACDFCLHCVKLEAKPEWGQAAG